MAGENTEVRDEVTPTAEELEAAAAAEAAAEEEARIKAEEEAAKSASEKKYTDKDMEQLRKKYRKEADEKARVAALETENRLLKEQQEKGSKKDPEVTTVEKPVRPKSSEFEDSDEGRKAYEEALDKYEDTRDQWREQELTRIHTERAEKDRSSAAIEKFQSAVRTQVEAGRKEYKDFDDVVVENTDAKFSPMMVAAITRKENGHDVSYFLGKNPEEFARISALDPIELAGEIAIISERLKAEKAGKKPPQAKQKTGAPAPAATVTAKSKVSTDTVLEGKTPADRVALIEEAARKRRLAGR